MSDRSYNQATTGQVVGTALTQTISNLEDIEATIHRNTSRVRTLSDQVFGSEPSKLGGSEVGPAPVSNIFQMVERVRKALAEQEATIDRFYNG